MSVNVKLNNVVYNGIERMRLPLASGDGFASFLLEGEEPGPAPGRNPLYALGEQWDQNDTHRATVTFNGNHVKIQFNQTVSNVLLFFNLRTYVYEENSDDVVNNRPKWFTIPAGSGTLKLTNLVNPSNVIVGLNFRKANDSVSLNFLIGNASGNTLERTSTVETAVDASCLFIVFDAHTFGTINAGTVVEFDIEFTVNGVLYL